MERNKKLSFCHLESRIHFQEIKILLWVHKEFYSSSRRILDCFGKSYSLFPHCSPSRRVQKNAASAESVVHFEWKSSYILCALYKNVLKVYSDMIICINLIFHIICFTCTYMLIVLLSTHLNKLQIFRKHLNFPHYTATSINL